MSNEKHEGNNQPSLVFVGHARLPQSLAPGDAPIVLVELEVEGKDGLVTTVEVSSPLPAAKRLLTRLLLGRSLETDYEDAMGEFQQPFLSGRLIGDGSSRRGLNRDESF
ncbi:MAG: DUF3870 domain-containing protein [Dehalococcoidia bacterium]